MKRNGKWQYLLFTMIIGLIFSFGCSQKKNTFRFVFMTDIHVQPEIRASEGFAAAINKVNSLNPDFVITGGDLVYDVLRKEYSRADSVYNLYGEVSKQFKMPVYNTIGNHEVFGLYKESGIDPTHPKYGKTMFLERIGNGKTYLSFDHKGWHFILLDGIGFTPERRYYGYVDSVQIEWLRKDLAKLAPETPVVISTHIPFFSVWAQMQNGPTAALKNSSVITNALEVMDVLADNNLKLVLQGHLHEVEQIKFRNVSFITGGAVSAEWWRGPRDGFPEGFVVVDVQGDNFSWYYETYGWVANP